MKPTDIYETPGPLFAWLNAKFGPFEWDVAASKHNAKCAKYLTESDNALALPWVGRWFCNPPYSEIASKGWIEKARTESAKHPGIMLLPVRVTSNRDFHRAIIFGAGVLFLEKRVAFELQGIPQPGNPWPSIVLVMGYTQIVTHGVVL
jgi:phage N-6-adenine-methyltransferase